MMKRLLLLLIIVVAPFIGTVMGFALSDVIEVEFDTHSMLIDTKNLEAQVDIVQEEVVNLKGGLGFIQTTLEEQARQYEQQQRILQELILKSQEQTNVSEEVYENQILKRLGNPIDKTNSEKAEVIIFEIEGEGFRGYAAKVKVFDTKAIDVILANDIYGSAETTVEAAKRTDAILAVNGGGFFWTSQEAISLGNTVIDGKLVNSFTPIHEDLFFAGFDWEGNLVGDIVLDEEDLWGMDPKSGLSFVPMLIRDRLPLNIPGKWKNQRHPRTVLGQYANGDLLFMVIDGRQRGWSSGISLEQLQIKLMQLGAVDAYNLDGGGSSTFVYNGELLNKPSDGFPRPVTTNIVVLP